MQDQTVGLHLFTKEPTSTTERCVTCGVTLLAFLAQFGPAMTCKESPIQAPVAAAERRLNDRRHLSAVK